MRNIADMPAGHYYNNVDRLAPLEGDEIDRLKLWLQSHLAEPGYTLTSVEDVITITGGSAFVERNLNAVSPRGGTAKYALWATLNMPETTLWLMQADLEAKIRYEECQWLFPEKAPAPPASNPEDVVGGQKEPGSRLYLVPDNLGRSLTLGEVVTNSRGTFRLTFIHTGMFSGGMYWIKEA